MALVLALPAAAQDEPGRAAFRARSLIDGLPAASRVELRKLFLRYRDEVARRLDQGWESGVLSDAVIEDADEPFQPARLLEAEAAKRQKELDALQAALTQTSRDSLDYGRTLRAIEAKKADLETARRKAARETGICRDWSDDVWFALTSANPDHWRVEDRRRTARPFHTGAVVCSTGDGADSDDGGAAPGVCLVFDPWSDGQPDVYDYRAWDARAPGGRIPADYFLHDLPEKVAP